MSESQKFIARNRAPRVQIEYDVELYGSEKKVQLPFVMGVMSDLSGKSEVEQPAVADRKFLEIDVDSFDDRMKAMAPRVAFAVPNTLTGEGSLPVDITFESMEDFSPGAIAAKIEPLKALLDARTQLMNLTAYMDGKSGAETLIEALLADPTLLRALSGGAGAGSAETDAALARLRDMMPEDAPREDAAEGVLDNLRDAAPDAEPEPDSTADVLTGLASQAPDDAPENDGSADVLAGLADKAPDAAVEDTSAGVLAGLADQVPDDTAQDDRSGDVLAGLADQAPDDDAEDDGASDVLAGLADQAPVDTPQEDASGDILAGLSEQAPSDGPDGGASADVLAGLSAQEPDDAPEADSSANVLQDLAATASDDAPDAGSAGEPVDSALGSLVDAAVPEPESDGAVDAASAALDSLTADPVVDAVADPDLDDILGGLDSADPQPTPADVADDALESLAAAPVAEEPEAPDLDDILGDLDAPDVAEEGDDAALSALDSLDAPPEEPSGDDGLDDVLGDLAAAEPVADHAAEAAPDALKSLAAAPVAEEPSEPDLDDILGNLDAPDVAEEDDDAALSALDSLDAPPEEPSGDDGLDDVLGDLSAVPEDGSPDDDGLDDFLSDLGGLDDTSQVAEDVGTSEESAAGSLDDLLADTDGDPLDDLLPDGAGAGLDELLADSPDTTADDLLAESADDPLNDLLAETAPVDAADADLLDDLLADLDDGGLDDLLADEEAPGAVDPIDAVAEGRAENVSEDGPPDSAPDTATDTPAAQPTLSKEPEFAFGTLSADRPAPERLERKRFRIALLGDFSGRAARGAMETGDALAAREPVLLDPDTVEDIIEGFARTLVLPLGADGDGVEIAIKGLDDLHPDELFENVDLFSELAGLRGQLQAGSTSAGAVERLRGWAGQHGIPLAPPKLTSAATSVPADLRLSDFQRLIGDHDAELTRASPAEDLIARIVGPHVKTVPDADAVALTKVVDEAISATMRLILHHPDFQALESQWRSLDLLARSIETDDTLEVMLYDISAEEIAADLASADDLSQSGLARLLTEAPMDPETGRGGYSALIGLYAFEETPPHAELLGRVSRVAAHVDAAFFAAMTPAFLETAKEDRHALVAQGWDTLRAMPEAAYMGLASPRFLLRRPYGAKSEPIYAFEFEEFSMSEGLRGMLWANPAVLVAILLAQSFRKNGPALDLGSVMGLGDVPFHYITDRFGDQVALPCTERNLTLEKVEHAMARGLMPVVWIKGRDEIRLASFQSLGGDTIRGPWSDLPPAAKSPPVPRAPDPDEDPGDASADDPGDLDDLLAEFSAEAGNSPSADSGDGDIDADLAALLEDL